MFSKKMIIKIDGMHCNHCKDSVIEALKNIENIKNVKIDLDKKEATIYYKNAIDIKKIVEVIENLGYKVIK